MSIFEKLETRKEQVLQVTKNRGIAQQKAQVVVCLDRSGSMSSLYKSGTVQDVVERLLPIGMAMDDNESIDFYAFEDRFTKTANVTQSNIKNYVDKNVNILGWGGTQYAPVIKAVAAECGISFSSQAATAQPQQTQGFLSRMFGGGGNDAPVAELTSTPTTMEYPTLVLFLTDGDNSDKAETEKIIRELSKHGIFFQFVGLGNESFAFLDKLDNLSGRKIDNANFFKIRDISQMSDMDLYNQLLTEFPSWLTLAKQHKMVK